MMENQNEIWMKKTMLTDKWHSTLIINKRELIITKVKKEREKRRKKREKITTERKWKKKEKKGEKRGKK
jgi:hypothetical protein